VDALVVPPADADALAGAVTRLLQDPSLRARLAATAAAGVNAYTADAVAPDLRAAVHRLLG
jgi:glycogen(starch) synthase